MCAPTSNPIAFGLSNEKVSYRQSNCGNQINSMATTTTTTAAGAAVVEAQNPHQMGINRSRSAEHRCCSNHRYRGLKSGEIIHGPQSTEEMCFDSQSKNVRHRLCMLRIAFLHRKHCVSQHTHTHTKWIMAAGHMWNFHPMHISALH